MLQGTTLACADGVFAFKLFATRVAAAWNRNRMNQQAMGSNDLLFEVREGIGRATFNRPQARNAFTFEMYERLAQICEQADKDRSIKVLVFQGAGDKAFASGTDINQFRAFKTPEHAIEYESRIDRVQRRSRSAACPPSPRSTARAPAAAPA
jgi:1,4-dihydroxy-2-naphthoyl-CoA synthase